MPLHKTTGFTLVELMIALLVGSLVIGAVYSSLQSQHASYLAQDQVVEMQQNLRAAMNIMGREIRMAGYDPTLQAWREPIPASILLATATQLQISMDNNENGVVVDPDPNPPNTETNEIVAFGFGSGLDVHPTDGIADTSAANLGRNTGTGGFQPIAENIHAVGFAYAFDADGNGALDFNDLNNNGVQDPGEATIWAVDTNGDGEWEDLDSNGDGFINSDDLPALVEAPPPVRAMAGRQTGIAMHPGEVRAVRIWLLARASLPDWRYSNTDTYVVGRQVVTVNDHFRRRLLESVVDCRNMGLIRQ